MAKWGLVSLALAGQVIACAITCECRAAPIQLATNVLLYGKIRSPAITESSGLIASRQYPGVIWTHNDSDEYLVAMTRKGITLGQYLVYGIHMADWEDISIDGLGNLYLADIGDNHKTNRNTLVIYQAREPNPYLSGTITTTRRYYVSFPGQPQDCEGFFILKGYGYIVSKVPTSEGRVTVYRFPMGVKSSVMQVVTEVTVGQYSVTAACLSRDKNRLAILTRAGPACFVINGDVTQLATVVPTFTQWVDTWMEGACFAGNGLLVSTEKRNLYLFTEPIFQSW